MHTHHPKTRPGRTPERFIDQPLQPPPRPQTAHWATLNEAPPRGDSANDFLVLGVMPEPSPSRRRPAH